MEIKLPSPDALREVVGDVVDGRNPRDGMWMRAFRDQANDIARQEIARTQKGLAEFRCAGGDCCDALWEKIKAAVAAVADIADDVERNRQINTSYANLYNSNPQGQVWAGTAAFVSKQAGCVMRSQWGSPNRALGRVNRGIFSSIYPPLRLYEEGKRHMTPERLRECVEEKMAGMKPAGVSQKEFDRLRDGVRQTMNGNGHDAAIAIADYEQKTVAQPVWDSEKVLHAGGKFSNVSGMNRDLYLTNACESVDPAVTVNFGDRDVTSANDRVLFYTRDYLPRFQELATRPGGFQSDMNRIRDRNP